MMRRPWEWWEIERIRDIPRGDITAVARELGRSVSSVASARYRLGVGPPKRGWTPAEDVRLDRLVAEGGRVEDAAASLGRSRTSAYKRRIVRRREGEAVPVATDGARVYA